MSGLYFFKTKYLPWEEFKKLLKLDFKNLIDNGSYEHPTRKYNVCYPESWWENEYNILKHIEEEVEKDPERLKEKYLTEDKLRTFNSVVCKTHVNGDVSHEDALDYLEIFFIKYYKFEDLILQKAKEEDDKFKADLKIHKKYKFHYWFGMFLWMTSCFWVPFVIGMLQGISIYDNFLGLCAMGFLYVCAASFTYPVTLPLTLFMGVLVHPKFLKYMMFSKEHPYNESLMNALGHSSSQEKINAGSVATGTVLDKIVK